MKAGFVRNLVYAIARQPIPTHEYVQATDVDGYSLWQHVCGCVESFPPGRLGSGCRSCPGDNRPQDWWLLFRIAPIGGGR